MIDMMSNLIKEFPEIHTKQGKLKKRQPEKYICDCGNKFSRLKTTGNFGGLKFGSPICSECGRRAKDNLSYNVWKRASLGQVEQEDFILNTVKEYGAITKDKLEVLILKRFQKDKKALGNLVYFGYLNVNMEKRDKLGIIEYTINPEKNLEKRYELIR